MIEPKLRQLLPGVLVLLVLAGCIDQSPRPERLYTVFVDLGASQQPAPEPTPEEVAVPDVPVKAEPVKTKAAPKPKKKSPLAIKVNKSHADLLKQMRQQGLLVADVNQGEERLQRIQELIKAKEYRTCQSLIRSFADDVATVTIDEAFIVQKNSRLLELIQELQPAEETLARIDEESENINQLLEQEDYQEINRRMNVLFSLLK